MEQHDGRNGIRLCVCVCGMGVGERWADRDVTRPETKRLIVIHELVSTVAPGLGAAAGWGRRATTSRETSSSAGGQYFDSHRFSHFIAVCMKKTKRK